jgi:ATP-dependent helicase/nuclease subunit B
LAIAPAARAPANAEAAVHETIVETLLHVLDQLSGLDALHEDVASEDFSHTFQHWLERSTVSQDRRNVDGVLVLNAAAARGVPCRALFVLGMNEGVFPRTIREDAFLRDRDREFLERDLGHKVSQKLAAFDEEKLLFNLLVNGAREWLYCSFQRADDSGRVLAPSWYLTELKRALGAAACPHEVTVPRSISDKATIAIFAAENFLLPEELAVRLSLTGEDPTALIEAGGLAPVLYKAGRKAVGRLDHSTERLHEFDGMVGPLADHWRVFSERGISPTSLETYASCPFQFFARHVLRLERLDLPEESSGPTAAEFGELGHAILGAYYRYLIDTGYFDNKARRIDIEATLHVVAQRAFAEYEGNHPVGYPLAWEYTKETLAQLLKQVIIADLEEISHSGYVPSGLEVDRKEALSADWPEPLRGMEIHGRMDRVDHNPADHRLRVIDYKFKFSTQPTGQDKDLYRSALRGRKLQPPFYYLLGQRAAGDQDRGAQAQVEAKFYYIAPRWRDGPLVRAGFGADGLSGQLGAEIKRPIGALVRGIRDGQFFIQRGAACSHCEVAEICRKNHPPSLWRADNDPTTAPHRELRHRDLTKP